MSAKTIKNEVIEILNAYTYPWPLKTSRQEISTERMAEIICGIIDSAAIKKLEDEIEYLKEYGREWKARAEAFAAEQGKSVDSIASGGQEDITREQLDALVGRYESRFYAEETRNTNLGHGRDGAFMQIFSDGFLRDFARELLLTKQPVGEAVAWRHKTTGAIRASKNDFFVADWQNLDELGLLHSTDGSGREEIERLESKIEELAALQDVEKLGNILTNASQILSVAKAEWLQNNSWSDWDQSVCNSISQWLSDLHFFQTGQRVLVEAPPQSNAEG